MGAYNTTCFASRQTIREGEPCLIFPIAQSSSYNPVKVIERGVEHELMGIAHTTVHPEAFWCLDGAPVAGYYEEAELIALDDTPANRQAIFGNLSDLMRSAAVTVEGKNRSHELPFELRTYVADHAVTLADALQPGKRGGVDFRGKEYAGDERNRIGASYRAFVTETGAAIDAKLREEERRVYGEDAADEEADATSEAPTR